MVKGFTVLTGTGVGDETENNGISCHLHHHANIPRPAVGKNQ